MAEETPVITQYLGIKKQHPNDVLFFRLGDFYEMFNEDALEVSRLLNLTLTHKGDNPMCGIPYHSADNYIAVFVEYIIYTSDRFRLVNNDCEHSNSVFHLTSGFRNI